MCGRYALFRWNPTFAALPGFPADQQAQWNISPNDSVLIQRLSEGQLTLARARWGLTPPWLTDLSRTPAHARAETLVEQPMFRDAFRQRRCLMPANGSPWIVTILVGDLFVELPKFSAALPSP